MQARMRPVLSADRVVTIAEAALHLEIASAQHLPHEWGNENWLLSAASGHQFLLKIGPAESAPKWSATRVAYQRAEDLGIPAPRLLHFDAACADAGGRVVRLLTWIDGSTPSSVIEAGAARDRFFADLGATLRRLHDGALPAFSSRLDGSAPSFRRWEDYVAHRFPQIADRARATSAFTEAELSSFEGEVTGLASEVAAFVRPALCHRDLHLHNLLAHEDGSLAGVLDFDCAEAWDPAVDLVKLRWQVFGSYDGASAAFEGAYFTDGACPERWQRRLRLVDLLELINAVTNARMAPDHGYEQAARSRLTDVLASI